MHGLVNRAIQGFLRDAYGEGIWLAVARQIPVAPSGFEAMLHYDDSHTRKMLDAAASALARAPETILEDVGTWLVSSESGQPLRRLLRFGGVTFTEFLHSLEELPDRGRLALPDLELPSLDLAEVQPGVHDLTCRGVPGCGHMLAGVLRAMADDYGALVYLDQVGDAEQGEVVRIQILATDFAQGRRFDLAGDG